MCEKCNSTSAECQRRYIVSCTFIDDSGQAWVSAFNESALELFGKVDADQLAVYKEVRSRRPAVLRRLHAIDATRFHQTRSWVVSFSILRPFGPNRDAPRRRTSSASRAAIFRLVRGATSTGSSCGTSP